MDTGGIVTGSVSNRPSGKHQRTEPPSTTVNTSLAIFAVLSAMTVVVLDGGITQVALPSLAAVLESSPAQAVQVVSIYQAGLVMALLPCGALGEQFGHRRVFATGLGLFVLGALGSAMSPSLNWLLAARLIQGFGAAAVMALGIALLRFTVSHDQLGTAIGWNALTVALASAAAPSIGAVLIAVMDWHWLFVVGLPLAACALAATRALPQTPRTSAALDIVSVTANAALFVLLILSVQIAMKRPLLAVALFIAAVLAGTVLFRRESAKPLPLVPVDLLRVPSFRLSVVASVCCFAGQTAGLVALPFHLQGAFGQSVFNTGFYVTAWPACVAITALAAGWLSDRVSTAALCAAGGTLLSAGLAGVACWPETCSPLTLVPWIALCGVGFGLFQSPNNRNLFLSAPAHRSGTAGGMQGTARVAGQIIGASAAALFFSLNPPGMAPKFAMTFAATLALLAGLTSLCRGVGETVEQRQTSRRNSSDG